MKKVIGTIFIIGSLLFLGYGVVMLIRQEKASPEYIRVRKSHYDSLKNGLLTKKQIYEKANNVDITNLGVQDSIIREYERRHHIQK